MIAYAPQICTFFGLAADTAPRPELGETRTRLVLRDLATLRAAHERAGGDGALTDRPALRTTTAGAPYLTREATLHLDLDGVGPIEAVTDWAPDTATDAEHAAAIALLPPTS
ncbi:hypothetical protein [Streptomyces boncukensis]|uniref:Uncharacterized protein n=1 Tax=Streptomyces boncukensis TaxID=2711219 RepID=A0A6G4X522_9ACTN|nr:hypothetical protein [Streptomyces boncukensis]NGO71834.1 hypothetical protein [Streptomyces boncukensis]